MDHELFMQTGQAYPVDGMLFGMEDNLLGVVLVLNVAGTDAVDHPETPSSRGWWCSYYQKPPKRVNEGVAPT